MSVSKDPNRQLSILGAYPGMTVQQLRQLGWRRKKKGVYIRGGSEARLEGARVVQISGDTFSLGEQQILQSKQAISLNRLEVFEALHLPYSSALESQILGPPQRGSILDFPDLGMQIWLEGDRIDAFHMSWRVPRQVLDPTRPLRCQRLGSHEVQRRSELRPQVPLKAEELEGSWSISGAYPGLTLKQLNRRGLRRALGPRSSPKYVRTDDPDISVVIGCEHSKVFSCYGSQLSDPKGKVVLERGRLLSPDLREISEALGVEILLEQAPWVFEVPLYLEFVDIGLEVVAGPEIYSLILNEVADSPWGNYLGNVTSCHFSSSKEGPSDGLPFNFATLAQRSMSPLDCRLTPAAT